MDPEIKQKWIKFLRENPDKQCFGKMLGEDKFCALGALFEIGYSDIMALTRTQAHEVVDWNDHERLTFPQIADKIEKKF